MSIRDILDLPATVPLEVANKAFGVSRNTGYTLARRGEYPCRVLRVGRAYRVVTADMHRVLALESAA